jgi:hypothetical protein
MARLRTRKVDKSASASETMTRGQSINLLVLNADTLTRLFKGHLMKGRLVCKRISRELTIALPTILNASVLVDGRTFSMVPQNERLDGMTANRLKISAANTASVQVAERGILLDG